MLAFQASIAQADRIVWELVPFEGLAGSITLDTASPRYGPSGSPRLGNGILNYEFRIAGTDIVWNTEDLPVGINVDFGATTSPADARVSYFGVDDDSASQVLHLIGINTLPGERGRHDIQFSDPGTNGAVLRGFTRFRLIPEPTTLALALLAATVGVRRR